MWGKGLLLKCCSKGLRRNQGLRPQGSEPIVTATRKNNSHQLQHRGALGWGLLPGKGVHQVQGLLSECVGVSVSVWVCLCMCVCVSVCVFVECLVQSCPFTPVAHNRRCQTMSDTFSVLRTVTHPERDKPVSLVASGRSWLLVAGLWN